VNFEVDLRFDGLVVWLCKPIARFGRDREKHLFEIDSAATDFPWNRALF